MYSETKEQVLKDSLPLKKISSVDIKSFRTWKINALCENMCWTCELLKKNLFSCTNCFMIKYCSRECQKRDWKRHRPECYDIHGVSWILRNFARDEQNFIEYGLSGKLFMDERVLQSENKGKDLRGCATTAQLLTILLTDEKSGYNRCYEDMLIGVHDRKEDGIDLFNRTILRRPSLFYKQELPISLIYSCMVAALTSEGDIAHYFTITQYGKCDTDPTYLLWQAYSKGPGELVYSLENWFAPSIKIPGVDPALRKQMSSDVFREKFLIPFTDMMTSGEDEIQTRSAKWLSLFGVDNLPNCKKIRLYFIVGYSYKYRPHSVNKKING